MPSTAVREKLKLCPVVKKKKLNTLKNQQA